MNPLTLCWNTTKNQFEVLPLQLLILSPISQLKLIIVYISIVKQKVANALMKVSNYQYKTTY